jgi:uncharacterized RDD family membrane protein YckC
MSREILVVTPENIEIEYELAGVGSRLFANLLDTLFQIVLYVGLLVVYLIFIFALSFVTNHVVRQLVSTVQGFATGLAMIAAFLVTVGYFIYFEAKWNGQTPGKRSLGLRVLRDGGYPINISGVIIRNLSRVVDGIPIAVLGGLVACAYSPVSWQVLVMELPIPITLCVLLFSSRYQRLGDFIAGTMVVKQRAPRVPTLEALAPPPRVLPEYLAPYALADIGKHVFEMTVPEYRAVRHAIDRRWQLPLMMQQIAAMRLAAPLMQRLGIKPPAGVQRINYANLLEYLAVAFEQYRGVK